MKMNEKDIYLDDSLLKYTLEDNVTAFTTTREGGCSIGNYASFNANCFCGDNPEDVRKNRELLCCKLGISPERLIIPHQIHKTNIAIIEADFLSLPLSQQKEELEGIDALITEIPHVCLCISTADCIPVLIVDKAHNVIAAIHAGWRGTQQRIVEKTLQLMNEQFHSKGTDCKAVIGPGISLESFEVGDEVYDAFSSSGFDMESIAKRQNEQSKWHIDLWEANRQQLINAKINASNIIIAGICTYINHEQFFSARRLGINSGRLLSGILLN